MVTTVLRPSWTDLGVVASLISRKATIVFRATYVTLEADPAGDDDCRSSEQRRRLYLSFRMEPEA